MLEWRESMTNISLNTNSYRSQAFAVDQALSTVYAWSQITLATVEGKNYTKEENGIQKGWLTCSGLYLESEEAGIWVWVSLCPECMLMLVSERRGPCAGRLYRRAQTAYCPAGSEGRVPRAHYTLRAHEKFWLSFKIKREKWILDTPLWIIFLSANKDVK